MFAKFMLKRIAPGAPIPKGMGRDAHYPDQ